MDTSVLPGQARAPLERSSFWRSTWERRDASLLFSAGFLGLLVLVSLIGPFVLRHDPLELASRRPLQGPSQEHLLGTDELGRSVLSRVVYGARTSLQIAATAVALSLVVGTLMGLTAAYYGGVLDMLIMRAMDVILSFPSMILAITVVTFLGSSVVTLIGVIGLLYIPGMARIVYTTTLSVKNIEFISAALAAGATHHRVIFRHVLPNVLGPVLVHTALSLGFAILLESGLSFLGLGPAPPEPTWGQMIAIGRRYLHQQPLLLLTPMMILSFTILSFNLLADSARDLLDPRLRSRG